MSLQKAVVDVMQGSRMPAAAQKSELNMMQSSHQAGSAAGVTCYTEGFIETCCKAGADWAPQQQPSQTDLCQASIIGGAAEVLLDMMQSSP